MTGGLHRVTKATNRHKHAKKATNRHKKAKKASARLSALVAFHARQR